MPRPIVVCKKYAILVHRWMGVLFCVLFAAWFVSGIVMMYWDFPQVRAEDRWRKATGLDASQIRVTPVEALRQLHTGDTPDAVKLDTLEQQPVYRFVFRGRTETVGADTGVPVEDVTGDTALRIAAAWADQDPAAARVDFVRELDQWTVLPAIRRQLPFWKATFPDGQEVYVSQQTGANFSRALVVALLV